VSNHAIIRTTLQQNYKKVAQIEKQYGMASTYLARVLQERVRGQSDLARVASSWRAPVDGW
jgi:hypothetical protein